MSWWFKIERSDRDKIIRECGARRRLGCLALWTAFCDLYGKHRLPEFSASRTELAELSGLSVKAVGENLVTLREVGLLTWEKSATPGGIPMAASRYRITPTVGTQFPPRRTSNPTPREPDSQGGGNYPRNSVPSAIKREYRRGGEAPRSISTAERIGLEKEQKRLEEKHQDLRGQWVYDKSEKIRSEMATVKAKLEDIAKSLGGYHG